VSDEDYVAHLSPVWRDRADFVIRADIREEGSPRRFEQLWARQIEEMRFVVCCIPFFVYDLALGDEVETDSEYVIGRVVRPSGGYTFRAWFGDSSYPAARSEMIDALRDLGYEFEWYSENLLAIHAPDDERARVLAQHLHEREALSHLTYETGRTS
jgi:Domain of unknown function (DUF4265)